MVPILNFNCISTTQKHRRESVDEVGSARDGRGDNRVYNRNPSDMSPETYRVNEVSIFCINVVLYVSQS